MEKLLQMSSSFPPPRRECPVPALAQMVFHFLQWKPPREVYAVREAHPTVPGTRVQLQHLILLEPGFAEILLNMNALGLLPLIPTSISKLLIPRLLPNILGTANRPWQGRCSYLQQQEHQPEV